MKHWIFQPWDHDKIYRSLQMINFFKICYQRKICCHFMYNNSEINYHIKNLLYIKICKLFTLLIPRKEVHITTSLKINNKYACVKIWLTFYKYKTQNKCIHMKRPNHDRGHMTFFLPPWWVVTSAFGTMPKYDSTSTVQTWVLLCVMANVIIVLKILLI